MEKERFSLVFINVRWLFDGGPRLQIPALFDQMKISVVIPLRPGRGPFHQ
ncbi:MAG: hypothetical protein KAK04_17065 [Cyclobacteriaceae bacterium]|nr:hypothetical protein [Cyclobacteriaceae bacterium]